MSIDRLLPQYSRWLANPPRPTKFRNGKELDEITHSWGSRGAEVVNLGPSSQGRDILAAVIGSGKKTMLAWGFPHPDEPLGSEALVWLGDGLLNQDLNLDGWRAVIILCPDPDQVALQSWFADPATALSFALGSWRPEHLGLEVDYGFPIDDEEFYWPEESDGAPRPSEEGYSVDDSRPFAPLAESLALARAIERFSPHLVASMHSTHSGGDYTFLLQEEDRRTLHAIKQMPEACGLWRHLGEPIDSGRPWIINSPDIIREQSLGWFRHNLRSQVWFDEDFCYGGNHSAAAFLGSIDSDTQFICPESTLFRSPSFANLNALDRVYSWRQQIISGERGQRWVEQSILAEDEWVKVHRFASEGREKEKSFRAPISRGALGVLAVRDRRRHLSEADKIWQASSNLIAQSSHPYIYEKQFSPDPGKIDEKQLRKFMFAKHYRQEATVADWASFTGVWPIHTAALLGGFSNLLQAEGAEKSLQSLVQLQESLLAQIPAEMNEAGSTAPALQSMIGRVLLASQSERYADA